MHRRTFLLIPVLLACCGKPARTWEEILPAEVSGGWRRGPIEKLAEIPAVVSQLGPADAVETTYAGTGSIRIRAFRMKTETGAFELVQKWRQIDGISAGRGLHFFVANADGVDRTAILAVLAELQRANSVA